MYPFSLLEVMSRWDQRARTQTQSRSTNLPNLFALLGRQPSIVTVYFIHCFGSGSTWIRTIYSFLWMLIVIRIGKADPDSGEENNALEVQRLLSFKALTLYLECLRLLLVHGSPTMKV